MTEVDPRGLTALEWQQVSDTLFYLWMFVFFMGAVAANFLVAHALIPTLVWTRHLPQRAHVVRPVFYLVAIAAAAGVAWAAVNAINSSEVLRTLYPKVWI